ncbi:MAG: O-antigen ligase family protein [Candidatus Magasanikbacteria bacterium]|nr:O-antigen ligase family protein [Candidatus Magasanikbacteria bacterium]
MIAVLGILFVLVFTALTWYRTSLGFFLLFLSLPTYVIRFSFGPLPSTLLEVLIWIILGSTMIRSRESIVPSLQLFWKNHRVFSIAMLVFILAATLSIFTSTNIRDAAGEWKAFYIEPMLIFFALYITAQKEATQKKQSQWTVLHASLFGLLLCGLITSIFAIYQHFTGFFVPHAFWANGNSYRVTGWYGYPNAVGLFLAPLIPLSVFFIKKLHNDWKEKKQVTSFLYWLQLFVAGALCISAPLAVVYAKSTGALVGIVGGIGCMLVLYKKTRLPALLFGSIALLSILTLAPLASIKKEILFQDRSGQIRVAIYKETMQLLKDRPLLGAGLDSYSHRIAPYHQLVHGEKIEIYHLPHNLLLSLWVNIGLFGMIAFFVMVVSAVHHAYTKTQHTNTPSFFNPLLSISMIIVLITGLVDTPYIKNDLSLFFWLLLWILLTHPVTPTDSKTPRLAR